MKNLFITALITLLSLPVFGQAFDSAVGLRLGNPISVSYKKFFNEKAAGEAYVGFEDYVGATWLSVNAAYLLHEDLEVEGLEGLQWYYGAGAGLNNISSDFGGGSTFFTIAGYIGLSYVFENIPLNLSIDWVPSIFIGSDLGPLGGFDAGYGALSARYILNQ